MLTFQSSTTPVTRRLKMLIFGGPGTGKTWFALHAPAPLVLDTESSTDPYRGRADFPEFWVAKSAQPAEILQVLEHLQKHGGVQSISPKTLVVDSFSVLWQVRREAGERRAEQLAARNGKDAERAKVSYYDWAWVKRPLQRLYGQLVNMPFNVIITAREKAVYDEVQGGKLEIVDYVADMERNAEYVFDLVLRLYLKDGKRFAEVRKSRFADFPPGKVIENPSWEHFAHLAQVGAEGAEQSVTPDVLAAAEAEATPPPAPWTRSPERIQKAEAWLYNELALSDADVNAALGVADWRQTWLTPAAFKEAINAYIAARTREGGAEPSKRAAKHAPQSARVRSASGENQRLAAFISNARARKNADEAPFTADPSAPSEDAVPPEQSPDGTVVTDDAQPALFPLPQTRQPSPSVAAIAGK